MESYHIIISYHILSYALITWGQFGVPVPNPLTKLNKLLALLVPAFFHPLSVSICTAHVVQCACLSLPHMLSKPTAQNAAFTEQGQIMSHNATGIKSPA